MPGMPNSNYRETPSEELVNAVTHGLGALASLVGLGALLEHCWNQPTALLASAVFGLSLVCMYACSACYHACSGSALKERLKTLDHVCIYLLIAGSYTPYCLLALPAWPGLPVLVVVWTLAAAGSLFELRLGARYPALSLTLYLVSGWLCLLIVPQLYLSLSGAGLAWLVAGGLSYTLGSIMYARHWFLFSHSLWHLFVMGGSAGHFASVWLLVHAH